MLHVSCRDGNYVQIDATTREAADEAAQHVKERIAVVEQKRAQRSVHRLWIYGVVHSV